MVKAYPRRRAQAATVPSPTTATGIGTGVVGGEVLDDRRFVCRAMPGG
jgi:hypothetical protein